MANISAFHPATPDLNDIISFDDFFGTAKRKFPFYFSDGYYQVQDEDCFFIYRIVRHSRSHTGLIAAAHVKDYLNGLIKKHENTLASKEEQMLKLFNERNGVIKPILLSYPNVLEIDALINRLTISMPPSFKIPFEDDEHIFWAIRQDALVQRFKELFDKHIDNSYICDGHHRAKTAEKLYHQHKSETGDTPYNYIMAAYFPASEIVIHNYNRTLTSLKGLNNEAFLDALSKYYDLNKVSMAFRPYRDKQMGMYLNNQWYQLDMKPEFIPDPLTTATAKRLDVHLFNQFVLKDILKIEDVRTEPEVKYVEGTKGPAALERKVDEEKAVVAFNLYPVAIEDLIDISDVGGTLPPKSTYIEPRMRNGFIAQLYS